MLLPKAILNLPVVSAALTGVRIKHSGRSSTKLRKSKRTPSSGTLWRLDSERYALQRLYRTWLLSCQSHNADKHLPCWAVCPKSHHVTISCLLHSINYASWVRHLFGGILTTTSKFFYIWFLNLSITYDGSSWWLVRQWSEVQANCTWQLQSSFLISCNDNKQDHLWWLPCLTFSENNYFIATWRLPLNCSHLTWLDFSVLHFELWMVSSYRAYHNEFWHSVLRQYAASFLWPLCWLTVAVACWFLLERGCTRC